MNYVSVILFLLITVAPVGCKAKGIDNIINEIKNKYASSDYFSCTGSSISTAFKDEIVVWKKIIDFSMKIKKPNILKIVWSSRDDDEYLFSKGALWSDGKETFLYSNMHDEYFSFMSEYNAINYSSSLSVDATYKIPSLFFTEIFPGDTWLDIIEEYDIYQESDNPVTTINITDVGKDLEGLTYQIVIDNSSRYISRIFFQKTSDETKKDRVLQLRERRSEIIKSAEKKSAIVKDLTGESIQSSYHERVLKRIDRKIEKELAQPDRNVKTRTKFEMNFKNISDQFIPEEEFKYIVPEGVPLKGNVLEQTLKKNSKYYF